MTRVSLAGVASYLPERWMTAAELAAETEIPENVIVEQVRAARKTHRCARRARQ